jgi:AraC family transcriptional regulator
MQRSMPNIGSVESKIGEQNAFTELLPRLSCAPVLSSKQIGWQGLSYLEFNHPSYQVGENTKDCHLLLISLSPGVSQSMRIDGRSYNNIGNTGEVSIVPAKAMSSAGWHGSSEFALLTLSPKFVQEVGCESVNSDVVELIPKYAIQDPLIYQIALSLKQDIEANSPTGKLFGESAATMLAARILQQHAVRRLKQPSEEDGLSSYLLPRVLEYIQIHVSQELSIAELAQMAGMSTYYFIRLFKKSMHITPRQYIIQQRIELAKKLLRSRELSIVEISSQCGFTSQSHLTTVFHQVTNTTPKAYQQGL